MQKGRLTLFVAVAALGLGLSGCADEEPPPPPPAAPASSAPQSETSEASAAPVGDAEVTAAGTELKVGETATVPFKSGDKEGTLAITVTAIDKGTSADIDDGGSGDAAKIDPYYVKMKVENVGGTDLSFTSVTGPRVFAADGGSTGAVLTGQVPGKCESESAPDDFTAAGASYETCDMSGAAKGVEIGGVEYGGSSGLDSNPYEDEPITWVL